jgi:hypothetical protein
MTRFLKVIVLGVLLIVGRAAFGHAQGRNGGQAAAAAKADGNLMAISKTGQVLRTHSTTAIFWGGAWYDTGVAGDLITGLDSFFIGFSGSHFAAILTEYYDRSGPISSFSTHLGHVIDPSTPPPGALDSATVIAEACSVTSNNPDPAGIYFVYTSTPATLVGTCATRSWGTCGKRGAPIQVVHMPYMTGQETGCPHVLDTGEDGSVTGHSAALGWYGNVTSNQIMNAITDPRGTGWKDANGDGISVKCDGMLLPRDPYGAAQYELFSNGSRWTVRMKWSNAAYLAGTGLPNRNGLPGCVY